MIGVGAVAGPIRGLVPSPPPSSPGPSPGEVVEAGRVHRRALVHAVEAVVPDVAEVHEVRVRGGRRGQQAGVDALPDVSTAATS